MTRGRRSRLITYGAAAAALAGAPVAEAAGDAVGGPLRASLCAKGGRRIIEIDFGGDAPDDEKRSAPCHAACIPDRKSVKPRRLS